ncbi:MAG: bile acid:sodium symporter [Rhizobiaceae bacterium]|nr:bile acid:sodium symporter [Rhizobiaceae bacterium]
MKIDYFLVGLVLAVIVGVLLPAIGADNGLLRLDLVAEFGICGVFFLYGLSLAPQKMLHGLRNVRLHVLVQLLTFAIFPAVVLGAQFLTDGYLPEPLEIGLFYVAALPSTVSSSVAMVSLARGNVPGAIFNATLSSLIGVVITPAWMAWYMQGVGQSVPFLPTLGKVALLVLLPIVIGQIARIWLGGWAQRNGYWTKHVDRVIILAIVLNSISDATVSGVWENYEPTILIETAVAAIALFAVVYAISIALARLTRMGRDDEIALAFCGSKKSLAVGVPLAPVIFGNMPEIGLIILPIILFHFFQLIIVSALAARYARGAPVPA